MAKRMVIMVVALLLVFGGVFGWKAVQGYFMAQYFANFKAPPEAVETATVGERQWQPSISAVGSLRAEHGVEVSTEVAGMVKTITFNSGQSVKQGALLVQLDDDADKAQLDGLLAARKLAHLNLEREQSLAKRNLGSEADRDSASTRLDQAKADVQRLQVQLAKKAIRAPFAGELGIRKVDLGQYLSAGTPIVTLQNLDTLYVEFSLPEQQLAQVQAGQTVQVNVDAYPQRHFQGQISAIDSRVDEQTRNLRLQATLDNPDHLLRPGMFANIAIVEPTKRNAPVIPRQGLSYSLYGDFVYVVKDGEPDDKGTPTHTVEQRFVTTGHQWSNQVAIEKGLKPGETVVVAGQLKLHDGAMVNIVQAESAK